MVLIKDKETVVNGSQKIEVLLRPAPWDVQEDAIQVPYERKDGHVSRSSPTMPVPWAVAVAIAGMRRFFSEADVAKILAEGVKRLAK